MSPPGFITFNLTTGEGYYTVTNNCNEEDVDSLKPKG